MAEASVTFPTDADIAVVSVRAQADAALLSRTNPYVQPPGLVAHGTVDAPNARPSRTREAVAPSRGAPDELSARCPHLGWWAGQVGGWVAQLEVALAACPAHAGAMVALHALLRAQAALSPPLSLHVLEATAAGDGARCWGGREPRERVDPTVVSLNETPEKAASFAERLATRRLEIRGLLEAQANDSALLLAPPTPEPPSR